MRVRDVKKLHIKHLQNVPFACGNRKCPKHQDQVNGSVGRNLHYPFTDTFRSTGCAEWQTKIFGISDQSQSDEDWAAAPLIGVVLPGPDPTGAQGMGGGLGVGRDIILESLWRVSNLPCLRVCFFTLIRGYSFKDKTYQGELLPKPLNPAAISFCSKYLIADIAVVRPEKLLLCGPEVGQIFFSGKFMIPDFRRMPNLSITSSNVRYPVQVTFNPYICTGNPAYLKSIWEDCRKLFEQPEPFPKKPVHLLTDFQAVLDYIEFLRNHEDYIAVDFETENLNKTNNNKIATVQFATSEDEAYVIPLQHRESPFTPDELRVIFMELADLFGNRIKARAWVAHGAKFENTIAKLHFGTMLRSAPIIDTQSVFYLLDETRSERKADIPRLTPGMGPFTLKLLAKDELHFYHYDNEILAAREDGALFDLPIKDLAEYGGMDAYVTLALLFRGFELALEQDYLDQLLKLAPKYYGPATLLTAHVETTGFKIDLKKARALNANNGPYEKLLNEVSEKLKQFPVVQQTNAAIAAQKNAGVAKGVMGKVPWVLDFNKPEHQRILFFQMGEFEPVSWSDKSNLPSVDDEFFEAYRDDHEIVRLFEQWAETKKLRDTFVRKIMQRIDPQTGDPDCRFDQRIRANIWYTRLVTGRWAITNPNLQQLPKVEEGADESSGAFYVRKSIKDLFTVDRDCGLIQVDYKVNEIRWAAILAQDEVMAAIFINAARLVYEACQSNDLDKIKLALFLEDIHRNTAAAAFGVPIKEVTKTQRSAAKTITFGILFGQGIPAIAAAIGATEEEAQGFQDKFFAQMVGVERWIHEQKQNAAILGYVEAPHGRRRRFWSNYLPDRYFGKKRWTKRNERQAVNSPIQGIASDASMIGGAYHLFEFIESNKLDWKIQNLVHDSCIFQVPQNEVAFAIQAMEPIFVDRAQAYMQDLGVKFNLPLGIDVEAGDIHWGSLIKWNGTEAHALELEARVQDIWAKR